MGLTHTHAVGYYAHARNLTMGMKVSIVVLPADEEGRVGRTYTTKSNQYEEMQEQE